MRYFFDICYLGTNYHGWQIQANALGIQEVVENALSKLLKEKIATVVSGRTDTGVHCKQQFFHADIITAFDSKSLIIRLNSFLPHDIAIRSIQKVSPEASARYDALKRTYKYYITTRKEPLAKDLAYYFYKPLDINRMNEAASLLLGSQDFRCFSKVHTKVNHFVCKISKATWSQKEHQIVFTISANRFLRGMVRAIVGTLIDVGTKKISIETFKEIIDSKDRKKAGANSPAHGLYLIEVKYPKRIFL